MILLKTLMLEVGTTGPGEGLNPIDQNLSQFINGLLKTITRMRAVSGSVESCRLLETVTESVELLRNGQVVVLRGVPLEKFPYSIRAAYIFPDPLKAEAIAAIVVGRNFEELLKTPHEWSELTRHHVTWAVLNLTATDKVIDEAQMRRLSRAEFMEIFDINRGLIVPIHTGLIE